MMTHKARLQRENNVLDGNQRQRQREESEKAGAAQQRYRRQLFSGRNAVCMAGQTFSAGTGWTVSPRMTPFVDSTATYLSFFVLANRITRRLLSVKTEEPSMHDGGLFHAEAAASSAF